MGTRFALNEDEVSYPAVLVEFGRVAVITDALLGEASRDAPPLLADSRTIPSTPACIQSLRIAIQWFDVLETELAVRAGAHIRYRRPRLPSRRPRVDFPQPTSGEVLCRVNPWGTSDSVSRLSPSVYLALLMRAISRRKTWRYPLRITFILLFSVVSAAQKPYCRPPTTLFLPCF